MGVSNINFSKAVKIIFIIVIIIVLAFVGYQGYIAYRRWQQTQKSHDQLLIETLKANEGLIIELSNELAEIKKRVVGDTLKETVVIEEEAPTYESKKEELIELRKDPEVNAEKIEVARIEFEERINEFQESPDKILINTGEDKIVIYEDEQGNLVSLESGITITRHRELSSVVPILAEEEIEIKGTRYNLKAGGFYSLDNTYGIIISKSIFTIWDLSINASLLLSDFEDFKFAVGGDVGYLVGDNLEIGAGYSTNKEYYIKLQYTF